MPGFDNWLNGFGFGREQNGDSGGGDPPPDQTLGTLDLSLAASSGFLLFMLLTEDL